MSRTVVNEPSGTVSPVALRTRIFSTSLGSRRSPLVGLRDHPEGAAEQVEVVDVGGAEIDLQRGEDVGDVDAEQLRLGAVDVEVELRRRGLEQREHLGDARRLRGACPSWRSTALCSACRPAAGAVLDHHAEAAGIADALHGRRLDHDDEAPPGSAASRLNSSPWMPAADLRGSRRALLERLEHQEERAGVRRMGEGRAGKADDVDRLRDARRFSAMSTTRRITSSVRDSDEPGGSCAATMR